MFRFLTYFFILILSSATFIAANAEQATPPAQTLGSVLGNTDAKAEPLEGTLKLIPFELEPGQIGEMEISLKLPDGFKAYVDQFVLEPDKPSGLKTSTYTIQPTVEIDDTFSKRRRVVIKSQAVMKAPFEFTASMNPDSDVVSVVITYQACTDTYCLFPKTLKISSNYKFKKSSQAQLDLKKSDSTWTLFEDVFNLTAEDIAKKSLGWVFLIVFIAGFLTSLTPCVFPMIPITVAILGNDAHARTKTQQILVSHLYVFGIASTYSILGVIAALSGALFGNAMNSPVALGAVCVMFLVMSLSMFGLFEIQAPEFIRNKSSSTQFKGFGGAFFAGAMSGIVASPCVGPVLAGVLTYVAKTQSAILGFSLLFVFALGMGQLFLAIGLSTQATKFLPRSGAWMEKVKKFFGLIMLGMFLFYLKMLIPAIQNTYFAKSEKPVTSLKQDGVTGSHSQWLPFSKDLMAKAQAEGKPVILDFYADWCAACKELEERTFTKPDFIAATKDFYLLRFDATKDSPDLDELKKKYEIVGLPTVVMHNSRGEYIKDLTTIAFAESNVFVEKIRKLTEK